MGQLGRAALLSLVQSYVTADDVLCRYAAAWSATLLGDIGVVAALQAIACSKVPYREEAARMALRRLDLGAAHDWRQALAYELDAMRLAVIGAGGDW